jgi:DNA-binding MarR family transcriptional regulator
MADTSAIEISTLSTQGYRLLVESFILLDACDRRVLQPFGLSIIQYNALLQIDMEGGRRLTDLSDRLLCDKSTVTRTVDWLENEGLARRVADPDDRRAQRVVLTPAGSALREQVSAVHEQSLAFRMAPFSFNEQQQIVDLLERLREHLRDELAQGLHNP